MSTTPDLHPTHRPVRIGYLVCGVISLGLAGAWALFASGTADGLTLSWLLPSVLLLAGVAGLVAMLLGSRRSRRPETIHPLDPGRPDDETRPYPTQES